MRIRLTKEMTLRVAPFLKFHIDENLKKELEVLSLIDKAARENAEIERRRAPGCRQRVKQRINQRKPNQNEERNETR